MFQRFRCCECYRVQNSSLSQQVLSKIVAVFLEDGRGIGSISSVEAARK